ncbi:helicase-exonuclease AddAB subunit AddB [Salibacterium halotolerans]|uniref:ATP-dependent helicase/deoxyribonuclease subunit B n=1 Tax=Salibacterium halotolerans TaxID=1884432 RepID=A0A1I5QEM2_9BACI|nr:helicase-exonuclease AddAB subunit AddB [Salibacterium halotolerans]SFP44587.1 DNA helicase/exodeoxyribonuclease V, subunit B [Salibacterium halotolerans]
MTVRFFTGRSGTGKTTAVQEEIINSLQNTASSDKSIIYLVPDQMTFQAEQNLVSALGTGFTNLKVLSFSRMAWNVLQETGGITRTYLQQHGIYVLIRKIIEEKKESFRLYESAAGKTGFIEQMEQFITECKRQLVSIPGLHEKLEELDEKEEKTGRENVLSDKIHDILTVWEQTEHVLEGQYAGAEDYLELLAEKVKDAAFVQEADLYIDGFHSFTPQEYNVLQALFQCASNMTFALTMDRPDPEETPSMLDLFYQPARTYQKLSALGSEMTADEEQAIHFSANQKHQSSGLVHLEQSFEKRPAQPGAVDNDIYLATAVNRRTEIEASAREINELVRNGYRYKDIAVVSRNAADYSEMLQSVFRDYNIPLFMDEKRPMLNHPVVECLRSTLETLSLRWRYEPLFRAWKTDMFFNLDEDWKRAKEELDFLENYVLAYGVQEKHWKQSGDWSYTKAQTSAEDSAKVVQDTSVEEQLNQTRRRLASPLLNLEKQMKRAGTVKEYCAVLYTFMEELSIAQKIEKIRDEDLAKQDLSKAGEHDQVWNAVMDLLDQMVEMAGEENVTFDTFYQMMETGFHSMSFAIVPPAVDQVTAADMERSRVGDVRVCFILGVNEGILPATFEEEGLLTDEERQWFAGEGIELADDAGTRLLNESFLIYRALTLPREKLYISRPLADEEGQSLQTSRLITQIRSLFPELEDKLLYNEPQEYPEDEQEAFAGANRKTRSFLTYQLQRWKQGYPVAPLWWDVYNWFTTSADPSSVLMIVDSLFFTNKADPVPSHLTRQLYGETLKTSVSRFEQFESCAFAQFASYGLRLRERELYKLEAPDIGQLFHGALKDMSEQVQEAGREWGNLSQEECRSFAKQSVGRVVPTIQKEILLSSSRYRYLQQKLENTVVRAADILRQQAGVSGFTPMGLELGFGPGETLPPLAFHLSDGTKMEVAGRIDRVDGAEGENGFYVRIIDYKSGAKDIRLSEVYYGLALQMLVYLDVVLSFSEDWIGRSGIKPAGVLYFHIHNPFLQAANSMDPNELEQEFFKRFKMKGLLMAEEEPVRLMDTSLSTGYSNVVPAAIKKDGSFYSNSSVLQDEKFEAMRSFIRSKLQQDGEKIMGGAVDIQPFKNGQTTACAYCSFKPVCQFDTSFASNSYRQLRSNQEEIVSHLFSPDKEDDGEHE